jgi:hypothetical protein
VDAALDARGAADHLISARVAPVHPNRTMRGHPARAQTAAMETRPDLGDAALAVAAGTYEVVRLPLRVAQRLPGMARLAADGAIVRSQVRLRIEAMIESVLGAPEFARAIDRALAGTLPDAIVRSMLDHHVVERLASELADEIEVDAAVAAALEHETVQNLVAAILASPGLDRLLVQATDRALRGPELQRVIEHVAASSEVREALTHQSTTMAQEMADGLRTRAETLDDVAERTVRGWLRRPHPA